METLETERLFIRPFSKEDAGFVLKLVNEQGFLRFIGDRKVRTEEDARRYIENGPARSYAQHGFGLCAVVLKETNVTVGMCGLLQRAWLPAPDIGFAFLEQYHARGFALESAQCVLADAARFQCGRLLAIVDPANKTSIRLLHKLKMVYVSEVTPPDHATAALACYVYRFPQHSDSGLPGAQNAGDGAERREQQSDEGEKR